MLNSSIAKILADLGHTDQIAIGDIGLPIPSDVLKIDLAVTIGNPSFQSVVHAVHEDMTVEKVIAAEEIKTENQTQYQHLEAEFPHLIEYISHEEFKKKLKHVKAVIRTGEATAYSNCILQAGVYF